jgi:hypothetical protein
MTRTLVREVTVLRGKSPVLHQGQAVSQARVRELGSSTSVLLSEVLLEKLVAEMVWLWARPLGCECGTTAMLVYISSASYGQGVKCFA